MPLDRSSAGDPARTLELLWRVPAGTPRRGPRKRLDIDAVVAVAIGLADADGLDAVTMRRVAQRLGVVPMTLYTYVPGKAELLDLMLDTAYLRMSRTDTAGRPWRDRLTAVAEENRALFEAHPWAATISTGRPPLGPGMMAKYEHELSALDGLGLHDVEMDAALTFLLTFVQANARSAAEARQVRQDSAMDDEQWWAANAPVLDRVLDPGAYPTAARVGSAAGAAQRAAYSPEHAWEFGLRRVLDGLAALIDGRAGSVETGPGAR
ncbi:TetR/AcrR family transcriptional regulator C-terminal domain-containing protein [Streptomyces huiliensis]|uniref:TetR/AcrR family transcriptional regulator C-terminal domain-containing protein n=1 Tax=Streptomyces huiliensis TaxID=2876027 RepID=UPI001CBC2EED|nr:TetR/AcrR family transcriptional regulator C-terminal domain-containing protein [Streptomyces huiliensis]MBZ4321516.1 TetR/AcrR family transcriptional regulator C-terminal domain-containing protein [Streptomyces huiliensis]